jgi:predicted HAD superfamily phosphohydrolase YqeG
MEMINTDRSNTVFIGDQLFTDVIGANLAGIQTILVHPLDPREQFHIILKRYPEKLVLYFYAKYRKRRRADIRARRSI